MKLPSWLPWVVAVLAIGGSAFQSADASFARAESARLSDSLRVLAVRQARVDTVHAVTVRTVVREVARLDTLTLTVDRWKHDTIAVVEYVTRADSLAQACTALIASCDAKVSIRDAEIVALKQKAKADLAVVSAKVPTLGDKARATVLHIAVWELGKAILRASAP